MWEGAERPYRITYEKEDRTTGCYYIAAKNRLDALADFRLRTGHKSESIVCVEYRDGNEWKKA